MSTQLPSLVTTSLLLVAASFAASAEPALESKLAAATVRCSMLESWGTGPEGEPWRAYGLRCVLPAELTDLGAELSPRALVEPLDDPQARYVASMLIASRRRLSELRPEDRVRFVLELARREGEPFASATVSFEFGEGEDAGGLGTLRSGPRLGHLAAPWDRRMTPVIVEYLAPDPVRGRASTLAVYLCTLLGDELGPEALPHLERIARDEPETLGGEMAAELLDR